MIRPSEKDEPDSRAERTSGKRGAWLSQTHSLSSTAASELLNAHDLLVNDSIRKENKKTSFRNRCASYSLLRASSLPRRCRCQCLGPGRQLVIQPAQDALAVLLQRGLLLLRQVLQAIDELAHVRVLRPRGALRALEQVTDLRRGVHDALRRARGAPDARHGPEHERREALRPLQRVAAQ